uniref:Uncharacterized protein n=1 Tax=Myotis myotis TaxID=51298 RepID=A0A7J7UPX8_MYOMY|nr:hypothetical protein mMyoMyo1_008594 [Myotis myotis]
MGVWCSQRRGSGIWNRLGPLGTDSADGEGARTSHASLSLVSDRRRRKQNTSEAAISRAAEHGWATQIIRQRLAHAVITASPPLPLEYSGMPFRSFTKNLSIDCEHSCAAMRPGRPPCDASL